jgi:methylated-DNA-[protein]-cysteine S-methyltransferase
MTQPASVSAISLSLASPVGPLTLYEEGGQLVALDWQDQPDSTPTALLEEARRQLLAYFDQRLKRFDLPLSIRGSAFQQSVCREMLAIPYGETRTYGDIARALHSSAQPVGGACGRNSIPIIIPCHRVLGAADRMTGFSGAGGIATKRKLLSHEGWRPKEPDLFGQGR